MKSMDMQYRKNSKNSKVPSKKNSILKANSTHKTNHKIMENSGQNRKISIKTTGKGFKKCRLCYIWLQIYDIKILTSLLYLIITNYK